MAWKEDSRFIHEVVAHRRAQMLLGLGVAARYRQGVRRVPMKRPGRTRVYVKPWIVEVQTTKPKRVPDWLNTR